MTSSSITAGAYDMSWRLFSKPLSCLCFVASGQRPLLSLRRYLRISTHKTAACGNHASEPVVQGSHRALHCSKLERRGCRHQPAYPSTSKLASGTLWLRGHIRHVCQAASILDVRSDAHKQNNASEVHKQLTMDYTALVASTQELKAYWIPAKVAQVGQFSNASFRLSTIV